ncbi:asparaginase domain-containing protein [Streptomyces atratus]|uniref:asparaginase domain-containing protein n=1 Tax=Streptomyces atratus TaxID=1893 RepID=UPI0037B6C585
MLTTGGSIDKIYTLQGEMEIGPPAAGALLEWAGVTGHSIVPVLTKDSLDLTSADRDRLAELVDGCPPEAAVVITHGPDTMPETGRYLLKRIGHTDAKTVVLTGAVQPAAMSHSDAAFNLGSAVLAARTLLPGVYVVMHGTVFDVATVRKDKTRGRFV